jgi:iron(II)-dependent oxidoreductase
MEMVYVPAGEFVMGTAEDDVAYYVEMCEAYGPFEDCSDPFHFQSEQPAHPVELSAFWIDRTEVTVAQYQACVDAGACETPPQPMDWAGPIDVSDDMPASVIFWSRANTYCEFVGGRLPTEAEWEYAARGPESLRFPWGDTFDPSRLNFCDASCDAAWPKDDPTVSESWAYPGYDDGYVYLAPVGSFPSGASWCGALDMAGNVGEWTADWIGSYTIEPQVNPTGPTGQGDKKVLKGFSWYAFPLQVRSANREPAFPESGGAYNGFRCVMPAD